MNGEKVLDISWLTIIKISSAIILLYLLFLIRDIVIWFLFSVVISMLFNPAINFFHRKRIPRVLATSLIYVAVFGGLIIFLYSTASIFLNEMERFSENFPKYFEQISPALRGAGVQAFANTETFLRATHAFVEQMGTNMFGTLSVVFGGLFTALFVISAAFFLSLEGESVGKMVSMFFPRKYEPVIFSTWERAQKRVTDWFLTRIFASLFVGFASWITFFLFDVRYPLFLAFTAGLLNFIPIVGPVVTSIFIFVVVGLDAPLMALFVVAAFALIQQIENNILTPILTKKFVGVSPAIVLLALTIGGKLWGLLGALLAIPLAGILSEFLHDFLEKQRDQE
jgi:predicted PurR-regulated permease PerM